MLLWCYTYDRSTNFDPSEYFKYPWNGMWTEATNSRNDSLASQVSESSAALPLKGTWKLGYRRHWKNKKVEAEEEEIKEKREVMKYRGNLESALLPQLWPYTRGLRRPLAPPHMTPGYDNSSYFFLLLRRRLSHRVLKRLQKSCQLRSRSLLLPRC